MSDEPALLKAVLSQPDIDAPRLAYADWLTHSRRRPRKIGPISSVFKLKSRNFATPIAAGRIWHEKNANCWRHIARPGNGRFGIDSRRICSNQ